MHAPPPASCAPQGAVLLFSRDGEGRLAATALTRGCAEGGSATAPHQASAHGPPAALPLPLAGAGAGFEALAAAVQGAGSASQAPQAAPSSSGVALLHEPLHSAPLCEALLGLYVGSKDPVCSKAKAAALDSLVRLMAGTTTQPPSSSAATGGARGGWRRGRRRQEAGAAAPWAAPEQGAQGRGAQRSAGEAGEAGACVYLPTSGQAVMCTDSSDLSSCVLHLP